MDNLLLVSVILPVLASPIIYFLGGKLKRKTSWLAFIPLAVSTAIIVLSSIKVFYGGTILETYRWTDFFNFGLLVDGLSAAPALMITFLGTITAIYSINYSDYGGEYGSYFALYVLYVAGMLGVVLSTNLLQFYLFWELMLVPSYFLIAEWGYKEAKKVAFKYFLFTHVGAIAILFGILSIYVLTPTHTFTISDLPTQVSLLQRSAQTLIATLLFLGFAFKMGLFPFHTWLPDAYAEAPTPISVLLSGVMSEIGAYALVRMVVTVFAPTWIEFVYVVAGIALFSMIYGGAMALVQDDMKRLLAYSSISQMGYITFGLSMVSIQGLTGSVFHIVNHGICKGLLFMTVGAITYQTGLRNMDKLNGLADKMPVTATAALVGALGIAGAPPTNGFQSEWLIFEGGFQAHHPFLTIIGVVSTALTVGYMLWMIRKVYFGPLPENLTNVKDAPLSMLIPMGLLTVLAVVLGVYPTPVLKIIVPYVHNFINLIGGVA